MKVHDYLNKLDILYVEDEKDIRDSLSILLKKYFKNLYIAENGKEGIELFKLHNPDIIITDIRMPIMDGIEMSQKIKEINPNSLIIVITAFSDIEYLKQAIDIGIDAYLTKPLELNKLFIKLNFFASIIKNQKEKEELLHLLEDILNNQTEAIILIKENNVILKNKIFDKFFDNPNELLNTIDLTKDKQTLSINNKIYNINIKKFHNYTLISFIDITDYENAIFKDSLTKLYNRKILPKIIEENLNKQICIIMLDIDNFKYVNDTYGHLIGDEVLKTISKILKNTLRKEDTITRWGGEEFLIILKDINDINISNNIANKIRETIEKTDFKEVKRITASFGICCDVLKNIEYFDNILNNTDEALYKAKRNGKNQVQICEKDKN